MLLIVSSLLLVSAPALADPVEGRYTQQARCWSNNDADAKAAAQVIVHTHDLLYDLEASAFVQIGPHEDEDRDAAAGVHPIQNGYDADAFASLSKNNQDPGTLVKADAAYDGNSVSQEGSKTIFQSVDRDDQPATDVCDGTNPLNIVPSPSTFTKIRLEVGPDCDLHVHVGGLLEGDEGPLSIVCEETE